MLMKSPEERQVTAATHRAFAGGPFSAKEQATDCITADRIGKWGRGDLQPRVWELRQMLPELLHADQAAALAFLDELLDLRANGLILAVAPRAEDVPVDLVHEAAEAGAAVGAVQAAVLDASRDGTVSVEESQEIRRLARAGERELAHVAAVAAQSEAHQQLGLVGT